MKPCLRPYFEAYSIMEAKVEAVKNQLCMACLCVERNLRELSEGKYKQHYLDSLNEIPLYVMPKSLSICWECEALLKKTVDFREQVKDSYRILQTYTSENLIDYLLTDISRPPRLKMFVYSPIDFVPGTEESNKTKRSSEIIKIEPKSEKLDEETTRRRERLASDRCEFDNLDEESCQRIKAEIILSHVPKNLAPEDQNLIEHKKDLTIVDVKGDVEEIGSKDPVEVSETENSLSDCLDLIIDTEAENIVEAKKRKKKTKGDIKSVKRDKKAVKKVQKSNQSHENSTRKIITIKLSYEEMISERLKESNKDTYKNAPYKCENCVIGFLTGKAYSTHMAVKHSPDPSKHKCPVCSIVFSTLESVTEHTKRHFRRYECTVCSKRTIDKKTIEQHYYSTHEITHKEYTCNLCGKISNSVDSHRYHKDTHKSRVQCPDCKKTFSHRASLMNHRLAVHEQKNTYPCTFCEKVFRWRTSLKRHCEKHKLKSKGASSAEKAFCSTCSIEFSSICSYRRHLRNSLKHVTRDHLRFICDHCTKRFADKTKLRDHIEEKHLHKLYHCQICNKATKNRVGLDQHIRYVHRGRPNSKMCHYCGKGFPTKVQLESHIRTHTGERPFICEYCPTTFSQKSNLYKHNRQVHLNIKTKRHALCKKRKEERKPTDIAPNQLNQEAKPPEVRASNFPEQFAAKLRTPEFIVGW